MTKTNIIKDYLSVKGNDEKPLGTAVKEIKDIYGVNTSLNFVQKVKETLTDDDIKSLMEQYPELVKNENGKVWMHPYLFIKFAMWLDPKFELEVIETFYEKWDKTQGAIEL